MQPPQNATEAAHGEQTATQRALHLPEILLEIMVRLTNDHKTLRTAIFVNKAWAEEAINVLWRNVSVSRLASVANSRRQFYAGKIHILDFGGDEDGVHHEGFSTLSFPRLRRVNVDSYTPGAGQHLQVEQYIQPSLTIFSFYGNTPADDLLKSLEDRCPRLRKVTLDGPREGLTPKRLLLFLERCRSLLSINLGPHMGTFVDDDILFHLAGRGDLRSLELPKMISLEDVRNIQSNVTEPFVSLRRLEIVFESRTAAELLPSLKSLRDLSMTVHDDEVNIFPVVSPMTELTRLNLDLWFDMKLARPDIQSLGRLNRLRCLLIQPAVAGDHTLEYFTLSDENFIDLLAKRLPSLEVLTFQVQNTLLVDSLVGLGTHCRHLKQVELPGAFDLLQIRPADDVLFPELTLLELGAATTWRRDEMDVELAAQTLANNISYWAPKLEELYFRDDDEFSEEVVAAFKRRTGNEYNS